MLKEKHTSITLLGLAQITKIFLKRKERKRNPTKKKKTKRPPSFRPDEPDDGERKKNGRGRKKTCLLQCMHPGNNTITKCKKALLLSTSRHIKIEKYLIWENPKVRKMKSVNTTSSINKSKLAQLK